jgi:hypothetical protein
MLCAIFPLGGTAMTDPMPDQPEIDRDEEEIDAHPAGMSPRSFRVGLTFICLICLALLLGGIFFAWPVTYTASTILFVSRSLPGLLDDGRIQEGPDSPEYRAFQRMQMALIKGRLLLTRALRPRQISELSMFRDLNDPIAWLEENVKVDFDQSPDVMRISLSGSRPQDLVVLLQAISDAYLDAAVNDELEARNRRLQKLSDALEKEEEAVHIKRRTYKELAGEIETSSSFAMAFSQKLNEQIVSDEMRELSRLTVAIIALRSKLAAMQANKEADAVEREAAKKLKAELLQEEHHEFVLSDDLERRVKNRKVGAKANVELEGIREELQSSEKLLKVLRDEFQLQKMRLNAPPRITRRQGETPAVKRISWW